MFAYFDAIEDDEGDDDDDVLSLPYNDADDARKSECKPVVKAVLPLVDGTKVAALAVVVKALGLKYFCAVGDKVFIARTFVISKFKPDEYLLGIEDFASLKACNFSSSEGDIAEVVFFCAPLMAVSVSLLASSKSLSASAAMSIFFIEDEDDADFIGTLLVCNKSSPDTVTPDFKEDLNSSKVGSDLRTGAFNAVFTADDKSFVEVEEDFPKYASKSSILDDDAFSAFFALNSSALAIFVARVVGIAAVEAVVVERDPEAVDPEPVDPEAEAEAEAEELLLLPSKSKYLSSFFSVSKSSLALASSPIVRRSTANEVSSEPNFGGFGGSINPSPNDDRLFTT